MVQMSHMVTQICRWVSPCYVMLAVSLGPPDEIVVDVISVRAIDNPIAVYIAEQDHYRQFCEMLLLFSFSCLLKLKLIGDCESRIY